MKSFSELKKGDTLLEKLGMVGVHSQGWGSSQVKSPWFAIHWRPVVVEKASSASYWIDGEKYPKDENGYHFTGRQFSLTQDEHGNPIPILPEEDIQRIGRLYDLIDRASHLRRDNTREQFHQIPDIAVAAELAERMLTADQQMRDVQKELAALALTHKAMHDLG